MVEDLSVGLLSHERLELVEFLVRLVGDVLFLVFDEAQIPLDEAVGAGTADGHQPDPVVHDGGER